MIILGRFILVLSVLAGVAVLAIGTTVLQVPLYLSMMINMTFGCWLGIMLIIGFSYKGNR
tara:strand:+ start:2405 stop:2584 length:180 start_codon:yes stop_codon:yes gene_type:complete